MGTAANTQLLQHLFAEASQGNVAPFLGSLAEGVRWTVTGTTKFSRTFVGKPAVLNELLGPIASQLEGPLTVTGDHFIAEGDAVVVEAHGRATTKAGKASNNRYCYVFRLAKDQIQEITAYMDTELVTEAFGR
jgi:uncharacterized protein